MMNRKGVSLERKSDFINVASEESLLSNDTTDYGKNETKGLEERRMSQLSDMAYDGNRAAGVSICQGACTMPDYGGRAIQQLRPLHPSRQ